jgi:hypothetical protein
VCVTSWEAWLHYQNTGRDLSCYTYLPAARAAEVAEGLRSGLTPLQAFVSLLTHPGVRLGVLLQLQCWLLGSNPHLPHLPLRAFMVGFAVPAARVRWHLDGGGGRHGHRDSAAISLLTHPSASAGVSDVCSAGCRDRMAPGWWWRAAWAP